MQGKMGATTALIVVLGSASCSQSGDPVVPQPPASSASVASPTASPSSSTATAIAPLTGLPAAPAIAARPAMAVLVGVAPGSPAPAGVGVADVVYAEYVEGGLTRLVALFQSRDAPTVGPVISTRPVDPKLLAVFRGCVGYAGGSSGFVAQLSGAGLCQLNSAVNAAPFTTDAGKSAPYNQFTSTTRLYAAAQRGRLAPAPPAAFAATDEPLATTGVANASRLTVTVPGRSAQTWTYDPKGEVWRSIVGGSSVAAATIDVLTTTYKGVVLHSPMRTIPSATVVGGGAATVVSGPHVARGSWFRPSAKNLTNVVDTAKQVMHPIPGTSWVLLVPPGTRIDVG